MNKNINDLRTHLFDALEGIKNGSIDIEKAKTMGEIAQVIINTAKVEVDYLKQTGAAVTNGFLDAPKETTTGAPQLRRVVHKLVG